MAKILIIDDDAQLARLCKEILELEHHTVSVTSNGKAGIEEAIKKPHDLILLDIMMPEMNGIEVLKQLKHNPRTDHLPIAILSNIADEAYMKKAMAEGAVTYIIRSNYDPDEFLAIVKKILAKSSIKAKT